MKKFVGILVAACLLSGLNAQNAMAIAKFKTAFKKMYVDKHKSKEFQAAYRKASCNICHIKGAKSKAYRNDYGDLLAKLIEGNADKRIKEAKKKNSEEGKKVEAKILEAFDAAMKKVAKEKSEEGKGPTYGKLIESGKLPVDLAKATAKYKERLKKEEKAKAEKKEESAEDDK